MDLHHVRYFLAVIDHGSINAAAAAVGVAPPTISQALRSLERELDTPLFHRIGRGMVPSSAGYSLVGPARRILRDVAVAGGSVPDADGHLRGTLEIRSHPAVSIGAFSKVVAACRKLQPRVRITIGNLEDGEPVGPLLRNAVCELVICHLPFDRTGLEEESEEDDDFEVLELGVQEYWVAYPPGEEAPAEDPMPWEALDTSMVVVPSGGIHAGEIVRMMPDAQRARPAAVTLHNREARMAFALAGVGTTWIERSKAEFARERGLQVRALTPAITKPHGLVFEPSGMSPVAAAFVELARAYAGSAHSDG